MGKYRIYLNRGTRCQDQILRGASFQEIKSPIGTADSNNDSLHEEDLDYELMSPGQ